jgi:uncharacterized membrane protein YfcA
MLDDLITTLFPTAIPLWQAFILVGVSFLTSFMSASVGIGGGQAMLGILASTIPVNVLISVHALVQVGSNASRSFFQRAHIQWKLVRQFAIGAVLGAIIGATFFFTLPENLILIILGIFILWMTWGPKITMKGTDKWGMPLLGAVSSFISTIIGSGAGLINSVLRRYNLKRQELIGTQAACVLTQHILKIIVFVSLGVALREWIGMILLMIATGFIGSYAGTKFLDLIPEIWFDRILKIVLTIVGLNLLVTALFFSDHALLD